MAPPKLAYERHVNACYFSFTVDLSWCMTMILHSRYAVVISIHQLWKEGKPKENRSSYRPRDSKQSRSTKTDRLVETLRPFDIQPIRMIPQNKKTFLYSPLCRKTLHNNNNKLAGVSTLYTHLLCRLIGDLSDSDLLNYSLY